jgi:hypothetical protein
MRLSILLIPLALLSGFLIAAFPLMAQTQPVGKDYFPAAMEFKEIKGIQGEKELSSAADLARLEHGPILIEAGLTRYAQRTYQLVDSATLGIEIMTLSDSRGAYSLLTLLSKPDVQAGPPGDFYSSDAATLLFTAGNYCVRIRSSASDDFVRRLAASVTNRIGRRETKPPNLIRHVPEGACDSPSIRYFLGPQALGAFGTAVAGAPLKIPSDVEAAQAHCTTGSQDGVLTLLSFPTIQFAQEYFNTSPLYNSSAEKHAGLYLRQTGPLVGILEGKLDPEVADKTLGAIKFSYSVKWIFDRNKEQPRTIWGVPVRILSTVVRSLFFTVLLCLLSIFGGIIMAAWRLYARRRWGRPEDDAYIRLKLDEN